MPGLAELVARELARREVGDGKFPLFAFIIDDSPGAMTDVKAATAAIIADASSRDSDNIGHVRVTVTPVISDQVSAALRHAYPKRMIMTKPIVGSSNAPGGEAANPELR
jgi:hypothetical protein